MSGGAGDRREDAVVEDAIIEALGIDPVEAMMQRMLWEQFGGGRQAADEARPQEDFAARDEGPQRSRDDDNDTEDEAPPQQMMVLDLTDDAVNVPPPQSADASGSDAASPGAAPKRSGKRASRGAGGARKRTRVQASEHVQAAEQVQVQVEAEAREQVQVEAEEQVEEAEMQTLEERREEQRKKARWYRDQRRVFPERTEDEHTANYAKLQLRKARKNAMLRESENFKNRLFSDVPTLEAVQNAALAGEGVDEVDEDKTIDADAKRICEEVIPLICRVHVHTPPQANRADRCIICNSMPDGGEPPYLDLPCVKRTDNAFLTFTGRLILRLQPLEMCTQVHGMRGGEMIRQVMCPDCIAGAVSARILTDGEARDAGICCAVCKILQSGYQQMATAFRDILSETEQGEREDLAREFSMANEYASYVFKALSQNAEMLGRLIFTILKIAESEARMGKLDITHDPGVRRARETLRRANAVCGGQALEVVKRIEAERKRCAEGRISEIERQSAEIAAEEERLKERKRQLARERQLVAKAAEVGMQEVKELETKVQTVAKKASAAKSKLSYACKIAELLHEAKDCFLVYKCPSCKLTGLPHDNCMSVSCPTTDCRVIFCGGCGKALQLNARHLPESEWHAFRQDRVAKGRVPPGIELVGNANGSMEHTCNCARQIERRMAALRIPFSYEGAFTKVQELAKFHIVEGLDRLTTFLQKEVYQKRNESAQVISDVKERIAAEYRNWGVTHFDMDEKFRDEKLLPALRRVPK